MTATTAITFYDWTQDLDDIGAALDLEWLSLAEDIGWELVNWMPESSIVRILKDARWEHRYVLAWVLGWKGKRALPVLWQLAEDEVREVAREAKRWIEFLNPMPPTPRVIYLPAPDLQQRLPGF